MSDATSIAPATAATAAGAGAGAGAGAPAEESQYVPYRQLLADSFTAQGHAARLVQATTAGSGDAPPLDLAPALARALFDAQEVDTHLDALTSARAGELVAYTAARSAASARVLAAVDAQAAALRASYARLQRDVVARWAAADEARRAAERLSATLRLGREVQRVVVLGRRLEAGMEEMAAAARSGGSSGSNNGSGSGKGSVETARTVLELRRCLVEGRGMLEKVRVVAAVKSDVLGPVERALLSRAQTTVREFSLSGLLASTASGSTGEKTFAQAEEAKTRAVAALQTLYLLSPVKGDTTTTDRFEPALLLQALQAYLQTALTSSLAALSRALATLPTLDRTLLEISARCQNIVALEALLEATRPPKHPSLLPSNANGVGNDSDQENDNFLRPLLRHLDTSSLPSYFWRSLAGQLTSRVQEILNRGGVSARTLRTNRDRVRDAVRECVDRGSRLPSVAGGRRESKGNWEREAAVMVGSLLGVLGR